MDTPEQIVDEILSALPEAYQEFLKEEKLEDNPITQLGFISAALKVTKEEPLEDSETQALLERRLEERMKELTVLIRDYIRNIVKK